ncbi:unnamed protein product [Ixodes pacificus]
MLRNTSLMGNPIDHLRQLMLHHNYFSAELMEGTDARSWI